MNDRFSNVYDKITAPEDLKKETLAMMEKENEKYSQAGGVRTKSFGGKGLVFAVSFAAAVVCVAALCLALQRPSGAVYITDMTGNVYHDDVELEDGVIHFVANRVSISVSPNAGSASADHEQEIADNTEELIEEITVDSGGTITFRHTSPLSSAETAGDSWSCIGEQSIYVTVSKKEEVKYQAYFETEGQAYEVIGINVTQKEFIDYLYKTIK